MPELLSQVVVHSFIATLVVEALVRSWEVPPSQRVLCRLGSLALPVLVVPWFELLAPFRHFELFASRHLVAYPFNPLWPAPALGVLLLIRDLRSPSPLPRAEPPGATALGGEAGWGEGQRLLERLAKQTGQVAPRAELIHTREPLLICVGARAPRLLISTGVLELLDQGELEAALAHELSHARHRDVRWSWAVLALRILQPFSPAAQIIGRVTMREMEWRADADAVRWTRRPLALASALLKVHASAPELPPGELALSRRAHALEVEARCRRLLEPEAETPVPPALLVAAGLGLTTLLFFVT